MNKMIKGYVADLVLDFLTYNRRNDEDLPEGAIEEAIAGGEITVEEIVDTFKKELIKGIG